MPTHGIMKSQDYRVNEVGKDLKEHRVQPSAHFGVGFRNHGIVRVGNDLQDQVLPLIRQHRSRLTLTLNRITESSRLEETCEIISPTINPSPPTELANHRTVKVGNDLKSNHETHYGAGF